MSKRVKFIALCLMLYISLFGKEISLEDIFKYASKNAVTLKIAQLDTYIEASTIESAKAGYYPTFNVIYNTEYTKSLDSIPFGSESVGGITISNGTRYQSSAILQMNYELYSFGATEKNILSSKLSAKAKQDERCLQEQQLYEQILEKYADALKSAQERLYKTKMLKIRKELYNAKERLYKAGQYSKVDLGDEAIYIIAIERDIENALLSYKQDIIKLSELSYMSLDESDKLLPMVLDSDTKSFAANFEMTAQAENLKNLIEAKKAQISSKKRGQLPIFSMYGNYYFYASHPKEYNYPIFHMKNKSWNVGFSLRFNLFNGFKDSAEYERLTLELQKLQQQYNDAKHKFFYENRNKSIQLNELVKLQMKDERVIEENRKKMEMVERLREQKKVDLLTELSTRYELLERTLNLEKRKIDKAAAAISLRIANRREEQCTQH